ncbi:MAG: recombinase family protein [Clostridia bacterium]|nr:recombinase family protein [Clostridia bacterium]
MDAIYLRKSRIDLDAEKSGSGNTLLRHKTALLDLAKRSGREIGEIYEEVRSGETIAARPEMQRLLSDVEEGKWDAVLVMEVERLARGDSIDQGIVAQAFKSSNTLIITPTKTYDPSNEFDEEYFEFGLFMSRREYKSIRRRMEAGKRAAVKEGKYMGKTPPFGYRRVRVENGKGWTLEIVPEEAAVVRHIYDLHVNQGIGFQHIARTLNDEGFRTQHGNTWSPYAIRSILDNITYAGYVYYGRRKTVKNSKGKHEIKRKPLADDVLVCKGIHEAIIPRDMYDASQARRISHPSIPIHKDNELVNPLQGVLYCRKCGHRMQLNVRSGAKQHSLHCRNLSCDNISARLPVVENTLMQMLESWLETYKVENSTGYTDTLQERITDAYAAKQRIEDRIDQESRKLQKAYDMLECGIYTPEEFKIRRSSAQENISELNTKVALFQNQIDEYNRALSQQTEIIPKVEQLILMYKYSDSPREKNEMLKDVLYKVEYEKTKQYDDSSIELWIYPRLNQE